MLRFIKGEYAMKAFTNRMAVVILPFILTACVGSSTTNQTATGTGTSTSTGTGTGTSTGPIPLKLNMNKSIYQTFGNYSGLGLPSGRLTITTDSEGTDVYGKYSVVKDGALVSVGTVSGSSSKLFLFSSNTSCKENLSLYPIRLSSATDDRTKVSIQGENCSGQSIVATEYIKKVNVLPSSLAAIAANIRVFVGNNVDMTISASSADNVTFLGTLSLNNANTEISPLVGAERKTATATVVGFSTYSSSNSNIVRLVTNGGNYVQFKVTNFSGHLFSPTDALTFPENVAAPQTYIRVKPATAGYEIDKLNVYVTDLTQSILLGNNPSDILTTLTPYTPL
jgi:hypothetical protein